MSERVESLATLSRDKRAYIRSIKGYRSSILEALNNEPTIEICCKIESFLSLWKEEAKYLRETCQDICDAIDTSEMTDFQIEELENSTMSELERYQIEFGELKGKLESIKAKVSSFSNLSRQSLVNPPTTLDHFSTKPKLPDIKVPTFDGAVRNFTEWYSLFNSMIHAHPDLEPIQKLYFLKQAMVGDAKTLLVDYPLSDNMYLEAWNFIKRRFYNKRAIIANHFKDLLSFNSIASHNIRESLDKVNAIMRGLKVCDINVDVLSPLISYIISSKLQEKLRIDWENSVLDNSCYPSFNLLAEFLQNRCFAYETVHHESARITTKATVKSTEKEPRKPALAATAKPGYDRSSSLNTNSCVLCNKGHQLWGCSIFLDKSLIARLDFVKEKQLCTNCLRPYHKATECRSSRCRKCDKRHNTLLHRDNSESCLKETTVSKIASESKNASNMSDKTEDLKPSFSVISQQSIVVLLPTAVVLVRIRSNYVKARVMLDTGSTLALVSESFVNRHKLRSRSSKTIITGATNHDAASKGLVELQLKSRFNDFQLSLAANIVGRVPYLVNSENIRNIQYNNIDLKFADSDLSHSEVDIVIGVTDSNRCLVGNKRIIQDLTLEESHFGWIASGNSHNTRKLDSRFCGLITDIEQSLQKFWEVEEVSPTSASISEHEVCEMHFKNTVKRLENGKFQVRLPLKKDAGLIADTYKQARASLFRSEKQYDNETRKEYVHFMQEYRELGHMEKVSSSETSRRRYFIPHHAVLRPGSSTTKLRVVFNASAKNSSGISLNEALLNGPVLQPELFEILIHFRSYQIAFSADISKMYRQTTIHPDDRHLQSIVWRDSTTASIDIYQLTTITYGTTPAAYLATKCLQTLAEEEEVVNPEAAYAISSEFYMDDLLTGSDTVNNAIQKQRTIEAVLARAHLPLRKYVSNSSEFLSSLDSSLVEPLKPIAFSSTGAAKILGLQWEPNKDWFFINVSIADISNVVLTKRIVSSLIARTFDPLGLASPVTITGKILLQDLWREAREWDEPISEELEARFRKFYSELGSLSNFVVPRKFFENSYSQLEIIGFCDSSQKAYGAVLYVRVHGLSNQISATLICAKSRVAPLKQTTIPRLELLGAVLLTRLITRVSKILPTARITCFCDSTIVLAWLKNNSTDFEVFVRNRVNFINSHITKDSWYYVKSSDNPADLITRGISVKNLVNNQLWLQGPSWLTLINLPHLDVNYPSQLPETRRSKATCLVINVTHDESLIARYSSYNKLIRIVSLICKFIYNSRKSTVPDNHALNVIVCMSQLTFFSTDISLLQQSSPLSKKSPILALNPFLDNHGLLRVGGRLEYSPIEYATKHPMLLHRNSVFAKLLVGHIHEQYFHASRSFILAHLRSRYWIHGGASRLVKKVIAQCVHCVRMKGDTQAQMMGDLPSDRATATRPFSVVGVDFAGPFTIKCTNHRAMKHLKYYAAFFTCFVSKATHIETVSDLSTPAFLDSLKRFVARRGIPNTIWSDNATNFVGAKNILDRYCESTGIRWKFIPPRAPNHGGIWEAAVKVGKKLFYAASKNITFTAEDLTTTFTQIEAIMNSRPLYSKVNGNDRELIDIITPGHLLVGSNLLHVPELSDNVPNVSQYHNSHRKLIAQFWTLWKKEYLTQLQRREKWKLPSPNLACGDIVLLKEDSSPFDWQLARVEAVFPDRKGNVRVVSVRTKSSVFQRAVQHLVKLPVM